MGRGGNDNNPEAEQFRKLFIGGLDYRTTDTSLKSFYEQWGEIVDVVVMKHPQTLKSRGFGFVTFSKSAMVDDAMSNRPHKIDGREVDSKRAVPRDESGVQTNANVNVKKMFVGGLKEQSEQDIRSYFGTFGTIVGVNIVMDKQSGKRKGYAFIEYDDYDPVDKALLRRDHAIEGKSVTVKKAVVKEGGNSGGGGGGRGSRGGGSGGRGGGGSRGAPSAWGGNSASSQWSSNGYGGPWDSSSQSQGNGWGGSSSWDQYGTGGGWNSNGYSGYSSSGGGPMRNSYSGQGRSAPYGGGNNYSSGAWGGNGGGRY